MREYAVEIFHAMQIFVRVIEHGSFTAAAESLGFSTPHVSRSISDLESHLQARLINRTTRKLALTEAGQRYLERCRSIIEEMKIAELEAAGAHLQAFGKLRVHSPNGIGHYHVIPLIAQYSGLHPNVDFELNLSQLAPDMIAEGYDLVISADSRVADSGFIAQTLGSTYSVLCAGRGYIEEHGAPTSLKDLIGHRCLGLRDPAFPMGWEIEGVDIGELLPVRQQFSVNVADALAQAAKENMGICLIPSYVAAAAITNGDLVCLLPHVRANQRSITAIYPSRHFLDAKVRTWIDYLKKYLPERLTADELILQGRGEH
ncbi:LysR family transcriptional regulator [Pseudomonas sp. GD03858]|uniref:LysR family transcriptional regulator n=1 Tax=unclassified Pseudomonas TaxID=196821 RepID=UPI00244CDAE4|nr:MULTISPECIES: LysR family transcriptional regulator [unclassified Pseudomonas]MDH0645319.1 LysR family transcriptional regulator [Pseudomonas sp. GD03867]MDH0660941.1 LysR family transcriptional regulator [Pseudomonas sp. GD03858]